jgi:hypothetical protein
MNDWDKYKNVGGTIMVNGTKIIWSVEPSLSITEPIESKKTEPKNPFSFVDFS